MDNGRQSQGTWYLAFGGVLIFFLLAFVNEFSLFGTRCFYVGAFSPNNMCVQPWVYYLGWLIGLALVLGGALKLLRSK